MERGGVVGEGFFAEGGVFVVLDPFAGAVGQDVGGAEVVGVVVVEDGGVSDGFGVWGLGEDESGDGAEGDGLVPEEPATKVEG